jgi:hypothetical protein
VRSSLFLLSIEKKDNIPQLSQKHSSLLLLAAPCCLSDLREIPDNLLEFEKNAASIL